MKRASCRAILILSLWMVPNSNGRIFDDIRYEHCMATARQNDWQCELILER